MVIFRHHDGILRLARDAYEPGYLVESIRVPATFRQAFFQIIDKALNREFDHGPFAQVGCEAIYLLAMRFCHDQVKVVWGLREEVQEELIGHQHPPSDEELWHAISKCPWIKSDAA